MVLYLSHDHFYQLCSRQNCPSTGFASWSRIDTTWMRCATFGPVMLINRKFDISCQLDILETWYLSRLLFQVNCIKKQAEVLPHSPFATGGRTLVSLAPPKQSSKRPQIEIWSTIKQWCLFKLQNVKPHCTMQRPLYNPPTAQIYSPHRLYGDGSVATPSFSFAIYLATMDRF